MNGTFLSQQVKNSLNNVLEHSSVKLAFSTKPGLYGPLHENLINFITYKSKSNIPYTLETLHNSYCKWIQVVKTFIAVDDSERKTTDAYILHRIYICTNSFIFLSLSDKYKQQMNEDRDVVKNFLDLVKGKLLY